MKNKTINILKLSIYMLGFILSASLHMNLYILVITLLIYSLIQAYQLKINGVSNDISGTTNHSFIKYFNVVMSFVVLFFIFYLVYNH